MHARAGDIFTKFDRRGNTAVRRVFMDEKHTKIEWTAVDGKRQTKDSSMIPIDELVDVRAGANESTRDACACV